MKDVRKACQTTECLKDAYETRIKELNLLSSLGVIMPSVPDSREPISQVMAVPLNNELATPKVPQACNNQIREILRGALELAVKLPKTSPKESKSAEGFDDLRTGYSRLIPDIAVALGAAHCKLEASQAISQIGSTELQKEAEWHLGVEYASQGDIDTASQLIAQVTDQRASFLQARFALALAYLRQGDVSKAKEIVENTDLYRAPGLLVPVYELIEYAASHPELINAVSAVADPKVFWKTESGDQRFLLVDLLKERGQQDAAKQVVKDIVAAYSGNTYGLIQAYIHVNELKKARNLVSRIESSSKVGLYLQISKASSDKEFSKSTLQLAEKVAVRCQSQSKTPDCWIAWLDIARGYAGIGDIDTAIQLTKLPGVEVEFMLSEIAAARALKLDLTGARRVIDLMPHSSSPFYNDALEALAIGEARKGELRDSQSTWLKIQNSSIQSTIIVAVAAESPTKDVILSWLELAESITHDEMQARSVQPLMAALVREVGVNDAQEWLQKNSFALSQLTVVRANLGIAQGALGIVPGHVWLTKLHL